MGSGKHLLQRVLDNHMKGFLPLSYLRYLINANNKDIAGQHVDFSRSRISRSALHKPSMEGRL